MQLRKRAYAVQQQTSSVQVGIDSGRQLGIFTPVPVDCLVIQKAFALV